MLRFRFFLAFLFCLLGLPVSAADYSWSISQNHVSYSSPIEACSSFVSSSYVYSNWQLGDFSSGGISVQCVADRTSSNGSTLYGIVITNAARTGDSCPTGTTYNSSTGACDSDEDNICLQAKGASTSYYVKTQLSAEPPDQVDINGCLAQFGGVIMCHNTTDGYGVCTGTATITGEQTTASSPVAGDPATVDDTPQVKSEELPCTPTTDPATGASICTTESTFSQPGESTCGSVNGKLVCVETVKSKSEDKVVETKVETTDDPTGSSIKTTTTTTSKTSCLGINNCTTTTSTDKKSTLINSDGSVSAEISSCTGSGCTDPTKTDEEKAGQGLSSGELKEPQQGSFADALTEWDQKIADAKQAFKTKLSDISDLVSSSSDLSLSSGGTLLPCPSFTALGQEVKLCINDYADELSVIRLALIFIATVIAFYIIFVR